MSRLKAALKTVLRYVLIAFAIYAVGATLTVIYVRQTGNAARELCAQVGAGMSVEKLESLAAAKAMEVERKGLEGDSDRKYVFVVGPNRESQRTVVYKGFPNSQGGGFL